MSTRSTHPAGIDQDRSRLDGIGDGHHDLRLLSLQIKLRPLLLCRLLLRVLFHLPPPLRLFCRLPLPPSLDTRHVLLTPEVPLLPLDLGLTLLERDPPLPLPLPRLGVCLGRREVGIGVGAALTRPGGPRVVVQGVGLVKGSSPSGGGCGSCTGACCGLQCRGLRADQRGSGAVGTNDLLSWRPDRRGPSIACKGWRPGSCAARPGIDQLWTSAYSGCLEMVTVDSNPPCTG